MEPKFKRQRFQVEDLAWLNEKTERDGWSANWSEMGAMKTTTGEWLALDLGCEKILIVTTKTGKTTYLQTLQHVAPHLSVYMCESGKEPPFKDKGIYLAHYNLFTKKNMTGRYLIEGHDWDIVILDEAHRIKNRKAQTTQSLKHVDAKYRHVMTGTGFINDPSEIWSLLNFLDRKVFSSYWKFRGHHCKVEVDKYGFEHVVGCKDPQDFRALVRSVGVRRTKRELFKYLKDPISTKINVQLNATQRRMYDEIKKNLETLDQEEKPLTAPTVLSQLVRLRQICVATPQVEGEVWNDKLGAYQRKIRLVEPSSKLDALMELLEGTDDKVVVFTQFRDVVALAVERFGKAGIRYVHMDVSDSDTARAEKVEYFQTSSSDEAQVFISTLSLGSESITLTSAATIVFLDRSWSPKDNEQAIARVHRPGQDRLVQVVNIEAAKTVDQRVEKKLETKLGWFYSIFPR